MSQTGILIERQGEVLLLTLDRPQAANTFHVELRDAFVDALTEAAADIETSAVILTGGGRLFSGGIDLKNPEDLPPDQLAQRRRAILVDMLRATLAFPKPFVIALNGKAVGGAVLLSLVADRIVTVPDAVMKLPEIDLGMASFVAASVVEHAGGTPFSYDIVMSGREVTAEEAAARRLATIAAPKDLIAAATTVAENLAVKPKAAFADLKLWFNKRRLDALAEAVAMAERRGTGIPPDETTGVVDRFFAAQDAKSS